VLQLGGDRDDLLVHEVADGGEDLLLDVGQTGGLGESRHGYFSVFFSAGAFSSDTLNVIGVLSDLVNDVTVDDVIA